MNKFKSLLVQFPSFPSPFCSYSIPNTHDHVWHKGNAQEIFVDLVNKKKRGKEEGPGREWGWKERERAGGRERGKS